MSAQRLNLPCNFTQKDTSRPQPVRPVGICIEKPIDSKTSSCSLKTQDRCSEKGKSLKRFAEEDDESRTRAKRKKGVLKSEDCFQFGSSNVTNFWFQHSLDVPEKSFSLISGLNTSQVPFSISPARSDDKDKVFNPWVDSIVTNITELGDRTTENRYTCIQGSSRSSSSSERDSHSLPIKFNDNRLGHEISDNFRQGANLDVIHGFNHGQENGFELVSLLVSCVNALGSKNIAGINHFIARLGELAAINGSSISRLITYVTEALALRVTKIWPHVFHLTPPRDFEDDSGGIALRLLNQISPIPKFIHFTSNEIILRAFEGKDRVHIIDFDIKQGLQWPSLFQSLAMRTIPPTHVRITGVGQSKQDLIETGYRLADVAEGLNLPFEFHSVVDRLEDVRLWMLRVKESETVAVNCVFQLHKLLYNENGAALGNFLGIIKSTNPSVVVMAEQEADHNEGNLEMRLFKSLKYYSAIFDSVDTSILHLESTVRMKIEEAFGREIRNIIACEGIDRVERHQKFDKWKRLMEQEGFKEVEIDEKELIQCNMILKMFRFESFSVEKTEQNGNGITMSWLDQHLYTVSAWKPATWGSSSSNFHSS